jgi:uncharacterized membrane protein YhaH (DUF805 family)
VIVLFAAMIVDRAIGLGVRRLQDTNRSGLWILLGITIIGGIVLIVWLASEGTPGDNQYGPAPQAEPAYGS